MPLNESYIISTIPKRGRIFGDTYTYHQACTELSCHASMVCIEYQLGREVGSAAADRQADSQADKHADK